MRKFNTLVLVGFLGFLLLFNSLLYSQPTEKKIKMIVSPVRVDCRYNLGEKVKFELMVLKNNVKLDDIEVNCEISVDMMDPRKKETVKIKNGIASIDAGSMDTPGFLRCIARTTYEGNEYTGTATVGFEPELIKPTATLPKDFNEFWDKAKSDAAKIPLDKRMVLMPEKCTEKVNVYHVSFQNQQPGSRIYGILTVPKGEGKYPALLKVPGAGIRPYNPDMLSAENGIISLAIGIHGVPVNLPVEFYRDLENGALNGYPFFNLDNKDKYYYKRVYLGCVRSIDFIFSLPEFDGENLVVEGGSQGGALSIVTASLDKRVKGLIAYYPALCDLTGYLHGRAGGWPHLFKNKIEKDINKDILNTLGYYDVVNFALQLNIPGFYTFGFNDMVCPPTSMYSAFNSINAPKTLYVSQETAHYAFPEQWNEAWTWLLKFYKKK